MNIIKVECLPLSIFVGYERENDARGVAFDYSAWTERYGDGVLQLLVQRTGDADPYPVVLTAGEDGTAVWSPSATDTAAKGWVEIQLIFMVGSVVAKTAVLQALVDRSLTAGSTPPDPYETWLETLTELAEQILHTTQPPEIRDGYWYIFDPDTGEYVNSGVKAEGEDGVGITGAQLNADYTLTLNFSDGTNYTTPSIRGAQGEVGPTPQLSVGTVTTGAAGSSAAVEISGTPEAPVLNFTIPKGADGDVSSASMAPEYSVSSTYSLGDYVWHAGQLFRCVTAISVAEEWTAAHWASVKLAEDVSKIERDINSYCVCKNLVGSDAGVLYPCYIPAGTYIVMSTSDGNNQSVSGLQLLMYNANKEKVEYYTFSTNASSRKVKYDAGDVYYLAWNKTPAVPLQVEIGEVKTSYVEYFYSAKGMTPLVNENKTLIAPLRKSAFSLEQALTVVGKKMGYPYANEQDSEDWTATDFIPVTPGDVIVYQLYGQNNTAAAVAFFDGEKRVISAASIRSVAYEYSGVAVAPSGASYVRFNNKTGYGGSVVFWQYISDTVKELTDKVPYYWNNAISTAESTIQTNRDGMSSKNVEFVFITDTHWRYNAKKSPYIINRLTKDLECKNVVFGGDQISGYNSSKPDAIEELKALYVPFSRDLRFDSSIGNHDLNSNGNNDTSLYISMDQAYNIMLKRTEDYANNAIPLGCNYWDNVNQKVRFIQLYRPLDQRLSNDVQTWVSGIINSMELGWHVVFFSHAFWASADAGNPLVTSSNGKADVDFLVGLCDAKGVEPIAWIVGHTHRDYSEVVENNKSLLVICTTTDSYIYGDADSGLSMTIGTDTEQAFDYYQIDTEQKTIKATRIGAGYDRSWSYN